jgi:hypothetical protein
MLWEQEGRLVVQEAAWAVRAVELLVVVERVRKQVEEQELGQPVMRYERWEQA